MVVLKAMQKGSSLGKSIVTENESIFFKFFFWHFLSVRNVIASCKDIRAKKELKILQFATKPGFSGLNFKGAMSW